VSEQSSALAALSLALVLLASEAFCPQSPIAVDATRMARMGLPAGEPAPEDSGEDRAHHDLGILHAKRGRGCARSASNFTHAAELIHRRE
jgi:hypothetical protein